MKTFLSYDTSYMTTMIIKEQALYKNILHFFVQGYQASARLRAVNVLQNTQRYTKVTTLFIIDKYQGHVIC